MPGKIYPPVDRTDRRKWICASLPCQKMPDGQPVWQAFFGLTIARAVFTIPLEHFQKNRSHAVVGKRGGLFEFWLRFGSVTGFFKPAPSPKPRQNSKILAPHGYS